MMEEKRENNSLKSLLEKSKRILVVIGKNDLDLIAAGLGLAGLLENSQKTVSVVLGEKELSPQAKNLLGWEKINSSLTRNFVIVLTSAVGNVEKVSYYTEGDDLCLVVRPYPQSPPFTREQVKFQEGGGDYDLIFVLGAEKLEDLGKIYEENKSLFSQTPLVNVSLKGGGNFGKLNLSFPDSSSVCEVITRFASDSQMQFTREAASNLLTGIFWATDNFCSPQAGVSAFEAAAFCLKQGGRKLFVKKEEKSLPEREEKPIPAKQDWLKPKIYQGGELV